MPAEQIERAILVIPGQRVMLDSDLVESYGVEIMRTFVRVRRLLTFEAEVRQRLDMLEATLQQVDDSQIEGLFDAIRQLMAPPDGEARRIKLRLDEDRH